jgi:hypothetical protein
MPCGVTPSGRARGELGSSEAPIMLSLYKERIAATSRFSDRLAALTGSYHWPESKPIAELLVAANAVRSVACGSRRAAERRGAGEMPRDLCRRRKARRQGRSYSFARRPLNSLCPRLSIRPIGVSPHHRSNAERHRRRMKAQRESDSLDARISNAQDGVTCQITPRRPNLPHRLQAPVRPNECARTVAGAKRGFVA